MTVKLPGLAIRFPFASMIVEGKKTIETRTYPIPEKYIGQKIWVIETGNSNAGRSKIIGWVIFDESFAYSSESKFRKDVRKHHVVQNGDWDWTPAKKKWGWPVRKYGKLPTPGYPSKRVGIKFTTGLEVEI